MAIALAAVARDEVVAIEKRPPVYRILVVDDNKACAQVLLWTMEMLGHVSQMALSGPEAIEMAKDFRPDIILLDIGLPDMNGYEICQAMRKDPALKNTVFIAQTGWGQKEHRERTQEAGFDYHLVKPVDIEALKDIFLALDTVKPYAAVTA